MYETLPAVELQGGMQLLSGGWQLQDMFATPPAPTSYPSSDEDLKEEDLCEVTRRDSTLRALRAANLLDDVTSGVSSLEMDPKPSIMSKMMGVLTGSILGRHSTNGEKKKGTGKNPFSLASSSRRSERPATRTASMMTARRAQASVCKQLGLIQREEDFNDEVMAQYMALYDHTLSQSNLTKLKTLAEVSNRPDFVLTDGELLAMLQESTHAG